MIKILFFTDLHASIKHGLFGLTFVDQVDKTLTWIAELADQHQVDAVFFLGDVFHVQQAVDTPSLHTVVRGFKKILCNAPVTVVEGNHDVYKKDGQWTSIEALRDLYEGQKIMQLVSREVSFSISGLTVHAVPYTEKGYNLDPQAHLMIGHLEVTGAFYRPGGLVEEHGVSPMFDGFVPKEPGDAPVYYVGGHYHHPQVVGHTVIIGACCYHSYQDQIVETPRGAVLMTLDRPRTPTLRDFQWIENPHAHPIHTVRAQSYAEAQQALTSLQRHCHIPLSQWHVRTYLPVTEADIAAKAQEKVEDKTLMVIPDDPPKIVARTKITSKTQPEDALTEYMDQVPPQKHADKVLAKGTAILKQVQKEVSE